MAHTTATTRRSDKLAEALVDTEQGLRSDRTELETLWQRIGRYVIPRKATFTEEVSLGVERNRFVLDSTAPRSLELFASFLHTLLNNPSIQWFKLRVRDEPDLNKNNAVMQWLENSERRMLSEMASESANLYPHLYQTYLDLGAFGTGNLFVELVDTLRIRAFHLADIVIAENVSGFVDTVHRRFQLTRRQAKQRWPDTNLGSQVEKATGRGVPKKNPFMHAVFPATDDELIRHVPGQVKRKKAPWVSAWVNMTDRVTVDAGIYHDFPYMVPRWYKVRGDIYGRSPAMTVLPDIQMVNRMKETILRGAEKLVDPPLLLPDGGLVSPIRLYPGAISFSEGNVKPEALIPPGASRIEVGNDLLEKAQGGIREGFFTPLFMSPESPVKTATEVLQQIDERNRAVSPMLINTQSELFHPFIIRVFNLMSRAGKFAPLPQELRGKAIEVEYISPLSASQQQMEGLSVLRLFESLAPWHEIDPGIFDAFDTDDVARVVHASSGAPSSILRSEAKRDEVRAKRQELLARERAMQETFGGAQAAAKLMAAANKGQS